PHRSEGDADHRAVGVRLAVPEHPVPGHGAAGRRRRDLPARPRHGAGRQAPGGSAGVNNSLAAALAEADKHSRAPLRGAMHLDQHSAPVTHIGQRILWTIVTLVVLAGIYILMWRGWKKRQARQADVEPLNAVPEDT